MIGLKPPFFGDIRRDLPATERRRRPMGHGFIHDKLEIKFLILYFQKIRR